uniref:Uncharacterized protein n=1 Tax=Mola mola TaxID=94237 RepID=A0A3Q3XGI3_MOLML
IVKRRSNAAEVKPEVKPEVAYDDGDDEGELHDENVPSEEEDEKEDGDQERRRQKLLDAISSLGRKRRRHAGERSEAAVQMSEFTVSAEGEGGKIELSELIGTMERTPAVPSRSTKQLKNLERLKKTTQSPLSKQQTERIQRDVAFQKAATEVTRWKGVIKQNRRAEQLVFPLNREPPGPKPMERVVTSWKARTPLEEEIFSLLTVNKQPINDPVLTPAEEASVRAMSLEEAKIRRAELQKARALQSYHEARARREKRIKSKKYHRVHNKAKRKEFLKQFEEMAKTDPAAALEELNKMEVARMQERMSLKHQNSGKWAKSKAIMAKYDQEARRAMQQQLEVNKELTQKLASSLNKEDEEEQEEEVLPDFVNDAEQGVDLSNPWMRGKLSEPGAVTNTAEEEEEEEEGADEDMLLREFESRRKLRKAEEAVPVIVVEEKEEKEEEEDEEVRDKEEEELSEFTNLIRGLAAEVQESESDAPPLLEEGLRRVRTLEEAELLGQEVSAADGAPARSPPTETPPPAASDAGKTRKRKRGIELRKVLTKETQHIRVPFVPTVEDAEDSEKEAPDQRGLIKEAFAGDDVIADFLKDKRSQEDAAKTKVVDLTLPGWGEWAGVGLKMSRSKRRKFRFKAPAPPPPRKDRNLSGVIISEKRNSAVSPHQVNSLPFPFENQAQFESTVRVPLGRTWNTERTVRKVTRPRVVTQLGAIIEPMTREELLKDKKQQNRKEKQTEQHQQQLMGG